MAELNVYIMAKKCLLKGAVISVSFLANTQKYRGVLASAVFLRSLSTKEINKNMSLISNEKKDVVVDNLKLSKPQDRPLVIMPAWLLAKRKHIHKYARLYLENGFDVLNVNLRPWQLLWPVNGTQVVAANILKFLELNDSYSPLVVHGFSVGGYLWGEVLVHIAAERTRYQKIVDRMAAQVWDSAADVTEIVVGVPTALFPKNTIMKTALKSYLIYHMKAFDKVATCHYIRSSQMFHTNLIKAPALIFVSKSDPIGTVKSNQRVRENWENNGMKVYWKCWDNSPHVGHMQRHPKEYIGTLKSFLEEVGLTASPQKMQVKV